MADRIVLPFADGVYAFALKWGRLQELQEKTDCGPLELYTRLLSGRWRMQDVRETIRLGLIQGGVGWQGAVIGEDGEPLDGLEIKVDAELANKLVRRYVDTYGAEWQDPEQPPVFDQPLPWTSSALIAAQVLGAGLSGVKDEPLGKKSLREGETTSPSLTESGDGLVFSQPSATGDGPANS